MAKTKTLILDKARELFNEAGTAAISTRKIASSLGISQGNLTYHFPLKSDMIEELYLRMVAELDKMIAGLSTDPPGLASIYRWTKEQVRLQLEYRFLWLEFAQLRKKYQRIDSHFSEMIRQRQQQFGFLLEMLREAGHLTPPQALDTQAWLFQQILVLGNFWLHAKEVFPEQENPVEFYAKLTLSPLMPYFSEEGKKIWEGLV